MKKLVALLLCALLLTSAVTSFAEVISDETGVLKMYGPGLFASVGENGSMDMVTGIELPGYKVLIDRWHELYPNVELVIDAVPWDNWKAAIQTAALSGEYDILIHGNGNADFCLDMTDIVAATPELSETMTFYPLRRDPENMTMLHPYGLSYTVNPPCAVIDLQLLKDYGIATPDNTWTWNDLVEIVKACTGTDPVSGATTYGLSMMPASGAQQNYIILSRAFDNAIIEFSEKLADCKFNFNTESTIKVLDFWRELAQYQSPDYAEGLDRATTFTAENSIAVVWADNLYNVYNKIVAADCVDRYMFLELPAIEAGEYKGLTSSNMADLNICIYKNSKQIDLATKFLVFLETDPGAQKWIIDTFSIPNNAQSAATIDMPAQYLNAITNIIATAPEGYNSSASKWYDSTWFGTLQSDVVAQSDLLLKGSISSAEMAAYIQNSVDTYLSSLK